MQSSSGANKSLVIAIIAVAVLIFGGLVWAVMQAPSGGGEVTLSFQDSNDPVMGPEQAKVVVRIFSDFQCPACKIAEAPLRAVMQKYQDRVRFIWNDFPLEQIHPNARPSANAARCAEAQGWFWQYSAGLFDKQEVWSQKGDPTADFTQIATDVGLNVQDFSACYAAKAQDAKVAADIAEGYKNEVDQTPTFFVNNQRYFAMSEADWSKIIDQALAQAK